MAYRKLPNEVLVTLQKRLDLMPLRSRDRRELVEQTAQLYGISTSTLYRVLRERSRPKALGRSDKGKPRIMPRDTLENYCEVIAALKIRTQNGKGRKLSTPSAIRLLEEHGVQTDKGLVKAPIGLLKPATINRYLKTWGYDHGRLTRQPVAVRFQAEHSNDCWHFDLSPSDLKHVKKPEWFDPDRGRPLLMLYSFVDDRSGVSYQEYHGVYGEDVEAALRFLFNAMSPKKDADFPFQGIPKIIYADNGPISRSLVFHQVLEYLGIELRTHLPKGKDGRRVTARSKGKVERPFRTVKEMHETLYHLHEPETEKEANAWLFQFLLHYNNQPHRLEPHARIDDWIANIPKDGVREMCSWPRFCTFSREPENRKVGGDARVSINGVAYEVDHDLAGEKVILWWGLFDHELFVEHDGKRFGPYLPVGGPIPLNRYRKPKKTRTQSRADRIEQLAQQLKLPREMFGDDALPSSKGEPVNIASTVFVDLDPFQNLAYPSIIAAKKEISVSLGMPLARLTPELMASIDKLLSETLSKPDILDHIRNVLKPALRKEPPC